MGLRGGARCEGEGMRGHVFHSHVSGFGLYSILYIFSGGRSERGARCESEGMRGHVFHSHASGVDCILY